MHAQLFADRAALLQQPASALGHLAGPLPSQTRGLTRETFAPVYQLGMALQRGPIATTFANMFLVLGVASLLFVPVPMLLREKKPRTAPLIRGSFRMTHYPRR
ncbi:MAG TPA: hypothetical protein VFA63_08260 [Pseudonocardiaceae bacterium]|nr:hypothetical protein [Pseudonocardiaceae bacterium]